MSDETNDRLVLCLSGGRGTQSVAEINEVAATCGYLSPDFFFCSFNKLNYSRQQKMIYSYQFAPHPLHHTNKHVHCFTDSGSLLAFTCHDTVCWRLLLILSTHIQSILFSWLFLRTNLYYTTTDL